MGLSIRSLLNLGVSQDGQTDGDSFASKYGSLFRTDNQRLLAEYAEADMNLQSRVARTNLDRIAQQNLDMNDTGIDTSTGESRRRVVDPSRVRRAEDQGPGENNVQFRALAGGPAGSLKA